MDPYTLKTKQWLDIRYNKTSEQGIYIAHQPIYGYMKGNCDDGDYVTCYNRVYHSLRALKSLTHCKTLLDVGASEGFTAYVAKKLVGLTVSCCDLSGVACQRAQSIFDLPATQADIHSLPYADDSFDIVLCNETLEHLTDPNLGARELLRVASKAVVITVPHEHPDKIAKNVQNGEDHAHLNAFNLYSFDAVADEAGFEIVFRKAFQHETTSTIGRLLIWPRKKHSEHSRFPQIFYSMFSFLASSICLLSGKLLPAALMTRDYSLFNMTNKASRFGCLIFILVKQPTTRLSNLPHLSVLKLLAETVPPFYPNGK
jgi:SAM-dependent methyltransferase